MAPFWLSATQGAIKCPQTSEGTGGCTGSAEPATRRPTPRGSGWSKCPVTVCELQLFSAINSCGMNSVSGALLQILPWVVKQWVNASPLSQVSYFLTPLWHDVLELSAHHPTRRLRDGCRQLKNNTPVAAKAIRCVWVCCCKQAQAGGRSEKCHMKEVLKNSSSK